MRLYRAIILKLSIPCIIEINVFNLLHQTNAQYYVHINIKNIAQTCFGTSIPTVGSTIYQV